MPLSKEQWEEALKAWNNVKKQAEIDLEQSELYISVIQEKIEKFK